ncbi:MAG: hypothetical protein IPL53_21645 [Ignavibacteria bacterium]|nr:hypothetical protein [Ignavibacteria bacterium]
MKNKIIIIGSLVVLLVFGFIYSQSNSLIADDKDGKKDCSSSCTQKAGSTESKSECTDKKMSGANTSDDKNGYAVYEFVTDKISCDDCKPGMTENIMGIAGVKEVNFGETCQVSKMTSVKVYFLETDTTPEIIAASVKEKGLQGNCGDGTKCDSKNKTQKKS